MSDNNVVYVLGAGFSAPLGVPVISNFLSKSKDQFFSDQVRYAHFDKVFKEIDRMSKIKNYFRADMFNIEEILSILEVGSFIGGTSAREQFIDYIKDVVTYHTPPIPNPPSEVQSSWPNHIFGNTSHQWNLFGLFIAHVLGTKFTLVGQNGQKPISASHCPEAKSNYSIVTLNYDLIPEMVAEYINGNYLVDSSFHFSQSFGQVPSVGPVLAKLHGSVDSETIVPPTWSKGAHQGIAAAWKAASDTLREANHIRIIGYSLPIADTYVRYLLKYSLQESKHLKSIDIICHDSDGSVKKRYDEFVDFNIYRFKNALTQDYLAQVDRLKVIHKEASQTQVMELRCESLETAHQTFFAAGRPR